MTKPEFKKGQLVNVYYGGFETAAVTYRTYRVAACGLKQMHLVRVDDGSNAEFRFSAPFRGERRWHDAQCASVDPVQHAARLRRQFAGWTAEHYADRTQCAEKMLSEGARGAEGYARAIAESKAKFELAVADLLEPVA